MAEQKPVAVAVQEKKSSRWKIIPSIILIIVLITLGFYGLAWATSDIGKQRISEWKSTAGKYNPFTWYGEQLKTAGETGRIWGTETKEGAEKVGINFQAFEAMSNKIVPSGSLLAFRYKFDVGEGVRGVPVKLACDVKEDGKKVEDQITKLRPAEPKIYTDDPSSYSNILCQVTTKEEKEDKILTIEGKVSFPYERQRASLRVYFTKDTVNTGAKFFEKQGLEEKLPIKAIYNKEPIELGLGVGGENIQPTIIGENYFPAIGISLRNKWDGKVIKIKDMNLYLPKEVRISKEESPTSTLCPFEEPLSSGSEYIRYKAKKEYLNKILPFGKGTEEIKATYQSFFCWLEIDESILGGSEYTQDLYSIDVSYDYEFQPKAETITLKAIKKEEKTKLETTEKTPEKTPETKYHRCQDKKTGTYDCVTGCNEDCEEGCEEAVYELLEDCEGDLPGPQ